MNEPWPEGYGRRVLVELDSTNAEAERIAPGLSRPEWILALHQTAARGRRGRIWANPQGNFAATLVMRPQAAARDLALRSFVASLALHDAFVAASGRPGGFALKWPNDVLLGGGKIAGILLESAGAGGQTQYLAIGFGVNLCNVPATEDLEPGAVPPVSLMSGTGIAIAPEAFLDLLAPAYARYERQFVQEGFAPIREAWLARATRLGEVVTARTMRDSFTGVFETVDAAGNLVLSTPDARHAIPAAEIFF